MSEKKAEDKLDSIILDIAQIAGQIPRGKTIGASMQFADQRAALLAWRTKATERAEVEGRRKELEELEPMTHEGRGTILWEMDSLCDHINQRLRTLTTLEDKERHNG